MALLVGALHCCGAGLGRPAGGAAHPPAPLEDADAVPTGEELRTRLRDATLRAQARVASAEGSGAASGGGAATGEKDSKDVALCTVMEMTTESKAEYELVWQAHFDALAAKRVGGELTDIGDVISLAKFGLFLGRKKPTALGPLRDMVLKRVHGLAR